MRNSERGMRIFCHPFLLHNLTTADIFYRVAKAAVNRTHSKRFARFNTFDIRASVWSAAASAPLFRTKPAARFILLNNPNLPQGRPMIPDANIPPGSEPATPKTFRLPSIPLADLKSNLPPKDWPHAPAHRLADNAVYFVTAGTLHKHHYFDTSDKRDLLERVLLSKAKEFGWQIEAWAILANHYHIVARGNPASRNLGEFLHDLHGVSSRELNKLERIQDRPGWFNFRDTKLTNQYSYLARLNYVHQNAVKHKLVAAANQYQWCSAAWFERVVSPAQVKTIYGFKIDRVKVDDDY